MAALTKADIKLYLRVDHAADDALIDALLLAASSYINNKTGKTLSSAANINTDAVYQLGVKLLCAHWYENRGVEIPGSLTKISHSIDAIIDHISLCGEYT